jgi:sterol desaturase/sphingolipid hydroxylase (fatty acid hydroxylase superfamily)
MFYDHASEFVERYYAALTGKSALLLWGTLPVYLVLAVAWEYFRNLRPGERSVRKAIARAFPREDFQVVTFRTDLFCLFAAHLLKRPLVGLLLRLLIAASAAAVGVEVLKDLFGPPDTVITSVALIVTLQTLALYVSDEFSIYVIHYLQHKVPILWASHRTHHSAEALTPLTASSRQTILPLPTDYMAILPIDFAVKGAVIGATLYWTSPTLHPLALTAMLYIEVYINLNEWFAHSRASISYGPLNRIINAPVLHQVHHSAELQHRDRNFGRSLSVFDWLFGTLYIPKQGETWRLGLDAAELGTANPHIRIRDYLLEPYRYAWASLRRRPAARPALSAGKATVSS